MHGNISEWCADDWHNNYENTPTDGSAWLSKTRIQKVIRGGSGYSDPRYCRSATRINGIPGNAYFLNIGFRIVCRVPRTL